MPRKNTNQVRTIILNYGSDPRNQWLTDPQADEDVVIQPVLATMGNFDSFFVDFTRYVRDVNGIDVIMTQNGVRNCLNWGDLVGYVFNLQQNYTGNWPNIRKVEIFILK